MFIHTITCAISLLWAGMILGISFLESWTKFRAPSMTREIGLDVGRTVFRYFHNVQFILLIAIIVAGFFTKFTLTDWITISLLTTVFFLQLIWLFPNLCRRVNVALAGNKLPDSYTHTLYGIFEVTKFIILLVFGLRLTLL